METCIVPILIAGLVFWLLMIWQYFSLSHEVDKSRQARLMGRDRDYKAQCPKCGRTYIASYFYRTRKFCYCPYCPITCVYCGNVFKPNEERLHFVRCPKCGNYQEWPKGIRGK